MSSDRPSYSPRNHYHKYNDYAEDKLNQTNHKYNNYAEDKLNQTNHKY